MILLCLVLVIINQVSAGLYLYRLREQITQNVINRSPYDSIPKVGDNAVPVNVSLYLANINYVNTQDNLVEMLLVFKVLWIDHNLKWNDPYSPANYIKEITVPSKDIWEPNLNVLVPVGQPALYGAEIVNVYRDGTVFWSPQMTVRINCDLSTLTTENKATCSIRVAPWRFPSQEVAVFCPQEDDILSVYLPSSKFQILSAIQKANRVRYPCCPDSFDNAELIFTFKRKEYYGY